MIKIKFKKLRKSEAIINTINERIEHLIEKFPNLLKSKISITVEMENSPIQAGPDLFKLKLLVSGGKYDAVTIEKCDPNLYAALADVCDHMLEALNRTGDKSRVKDRTKARKLQQEISEKNNLDLEDL